MEKVGNEHVTEYWLLCAVHRSNRQGTEAIGEGMHPKYEVIRNAIDEGKQVNWTNRLLKRSSCYLKKEQNIGQCL